MRDYEDLTDYDLDPAAEAQLLEQQTECTFVWTSRAGWPTGVIMSYLHRDGRFWLTASSHRGRVPAIREDPRVSVVVTSKGSGIEAQRSVTYRGTCVIHDDEQTKAWFYPALGLRRFPDDDEYRARFLELLDSPRRVVLEVIPHERIAYDGSKMHGAHGRA